MLSKPIRVCSCSLLWKTGYDRYSICVRERLQLDLIKIICSILTFSGQRNLQALAKTHMKMSACQLITTKARGVHRCESITLPCWWHKFDGNLRKWIRRIKLRAVWIGILSCVESFGSLPLGLHLSLAVDKKKGGMTTKCSPITAVWCAQTAHVKCAWWIGCIMHSSNNCSLHLTDAAIWRTWRCEQNPEIPKVQLKNLLSGFQSWIFQLMNCISYIRQ